MSGRELRASERLAARRRFAELLDGAADPPLEGAAALLSLLGDPLADVEGTEREIEAHAQAARALAAGEAPEPRHVDRQLFEIAGLRGNAEDYYDPRNSYLDQVLARRTGIPITLSVLWVSVARRLDIEADGVGFPGHFLVRAREAGAWVYLDAFASGRRIAREQLERRIAAMGITDELAAAALAPATTRAILARMLTNLRVVHARAGRPEELLEVLEWTVLATPDDPEPLRDRGIVEHALGHLPAAWRDLSDYLERAPGNAPDRARIAGLVEEIETAGTSLSVH